MDAKVDQQKPRREYLEDQRTSLQPAGLKQRVTLFAYHMIEILSLTCQSDNTPQDHKEGGRRVDQNDPTENLLRQNRSFGNRREQSIEIVDENG